MKGLEFSARAFGEAWAAMKRRNWTSRCCLLSRLLLADQILYSHLCFRTVWEEQRDSINSTCEGADVFDEEMRAVWGTEQCHQTPHHGSSRCLVKLYSWFLAEKTLRSAYRVLRLGSQSFSARHRNKVGVVWEGTQRRSWPG